MAKSWVAQQVDSREARVLFEEERAVLAATEVISQIMEVRGLSKADVARILGTSRANVTSLLSGQRNMTIRTFARLAALLGIRVELQPERLCNREFTETPPCLVQPRQSHGTTAGASSALAVVELGTTDLLAA
jgi:transcriptional regulator with XRE-family HTH domain